MLKEIHGVADDPPAKHSKDVTPSTNGDAFYARKFGSYHPGVTQFVYCDGSTRSRPSSAARFVGSPRSVVK